MLKISVAINTYNEEKNIRNALESVLWADEIVIVDMHSQDKTVAIAQEYPQVKVFYFQPCGFADPARQFAIEQTSHDWVLVLDADELIPKSLQIKIKQIMTEDLADVVKIRRKNYFFGEEIVCGGWANDMILRLFKKTKIHSYDGRVHSEFYKFVPEARAMVVAADSEYILHFNYVGVEHFVEKMNRYTSIEATEMFNAQREPFALKRIIKDCLFFIPRFMFKQHGRANKTTGLALGVLLLCYKVITYTKYKLMLRYHASNYSVKVDEQYQELAAQLIAEYKYKNEQLTAEQVTPHA